MTAVDSRAEELFEAERILRQCARIYVGDMNASTSRQLRNAARAFSECADAIDRECTIARGGLAKLDAAIDAIEPPAPIAPPDLDAELAAADPPRPLFDTLPKVKGKP